MTPMQEMMARVAGPGVVEWIGLRPGRREDMLSANRAQVDESGLWGDRSGGGKRAVTLLQAEHLPVIAALAGLEAVTPERLRRNVVVRGINLLALKGRQVRIGDVVLEVTGPCHPCSRMEEELGHGGYSAVRGHGGMCARVVEAGSVSVGDQVEPV
ncbi:MOSC domain-containing protein [Shimia ponticola]|uniref:MOSC domain-containing protein n=1 Tax=Shimia ponticola TaxID=2582893 RepID=UPI0011BFE02B|nr:MOSC domain-containing protein [Shimia ponticola]